MTTRTITLDSAAHFGRRVPSRALGRVLDHLPEALRRSVRMAVEGRSRAHGRRPDWLRAASDIRFLGHDGDDQTFLHFEAPTLGEAVPVLYEQPESWPTGPHAADTAFEVLADVFRDVADHNADSDRFDRPLLDALAGFEIVLKDSFSAMRIPGRPGTPGAEIRVTRPMAELACDLRTHTPRPRRVRVTGQLDLLRAGTASFGIRLDDGQQIRGILLPGDAQALASLLNQRVLVLGQAVYRPSGRPLRIDAEAVTPTTEEGRFFSTIPRPVSDAFDLDQILREQGHRPGIAAVIGQWPGDETEEEIRQVLEDLS